jgi:hypothetical protein
MLMSEHEATGEDVVRIFRVWHSSRRSPRVDEIREGIQQMEPE